MLHDRGQSGRSGTSVLESWDFGRNRPFIPLRNWSKLIGYHRPQTRAREDRPAGAIVQAPCTVLHIAEPTRGALLSVPKNHAPDLERAVLLRARRIASQPQRSQIKRREPTERLRSFAAVCPGSHSTFSLTAQKSRPPIAMSPRCAEFHAIGARRARPDPFRAWR
jgi:hypothetical protein